MNIGIKIEQILKERGIKQVDFAEMIGFTPKHVSNIVRGKVAESMPLGTLDLIAKKLDVPITHFFGETSITDNSQNTQTGDIKIKAGNNNQIVSGSNINNSTIKAAFVRHDDDGNILREERRIVTDPVMIEIIDLLPYADDEMMENIIDALTQIKDAKGRFRK
ncbi:MAG: hypothetical protein C0602_00310 [Denitrovibrio sp.]|nr:MAG: hypothetical protein C0602_00310 [Denitrovibrio sp.]